jgi:cytochrome c5
MFEKRKIAGLLIGMLLSSGIFADNTLNEAILGGKFLQYPKVNYGQGAQADLIKRGEYLAKAGDCLSCHTDGPKGQLFAGGLPLKTPFGIIPSTNITSDKETGIGNWTDEQFYRAMTQGIAPNGSYYFPLFPYPYFNKMSKKDVLAIKAYLDAVPAVHKENIPPSMPIPYRWRFLQFFWRLLFFDFDRGEFVPNPHKSSQWNTGAYLVLGLGHCGNCHTPMNFLGAPKNEYALTGSFVNGFYTPNITSTNFKNTPINDIVNVFLKDKLVGGGDVQGPMRVVNHYSLNYLNRNDLDAIAIYLESVKSKMPPQPTYPKGINLVTGKEIYTHYCAGCHTNGAGGTPKLGDKAVWGPKINLGLNVLYKNAITGIGGMPPKGLCSTCTTEEIQSAVLYIVNESGGNISAIDKIK